MPPRYYTATEAALEIGVNEKTVRNWRDQGKIEAKLIAKNRLAIPDYEIERIKRERAQYYPVTSGKSQVGAEVSGLTEKVAELEQRLAQVEKRLDEMAVTPFISTQPSDYTFQPQRSRRVFSSAGLPEGSMSVSRFGELHGVNKATFWGHVKYGIHHDDPVQVSSYEKSPGNFEFYVAPGDHAHIFAYWRKHGVPFTIPDS